MKNFFRDDWKVSVCEWRGVWQHSAFLFFISSQQLRQLQPAQNTAISWQPQHRMIPPSSPQDHLKCDYERAEITMSALVIKTSSTLDNVSCNVKTLPTEHAKFSKSYLIRYHERHLMNDDVCLRPCSVTGHSTVFKSHTAVGWFATEPYLTGGCELNLHQPNCTLHSFSLMCQLSNN